MIHYNKLIRDKIPAKMTAQGKRIAYHIASTDAEYWHKLLEKFQEEMNEFGAKQDAESFVDIFEVLDAMLEFKQVDIQELRARKENKKIEEGAYAKRYVLDAADEDIGHRQEQTI